MRDLIKDALTTEVEREKSLTPSGMELRLAGYDASAQQLAPPPLPKKVNVHQARFDECVQSSFRTI